MSVGTVVVSPAYAGDRIGIVVRVAPLARAPHVMVRWSNGYVGWTSIEHLEVIA